MKINSINPWKGYSTEERNGPFYVFVMLFISSKNLIDLVTSLNLYVFFGFVLALDGEDIGDYSNNDIKLFHS